MNKIFKINFKDKLLYSKTQAGSTGVKSAVLFF